MEDRTRTVCGPGGIIKCTYYSETRNDIAGLKEKVLRSIETKRPEPERKYPLMIFVLCGPLCQNHHGRATGGPAVKLRRHGTRAQNFKAVPGPPHLQCAFFILLYNIEYHNTRRHCGAWSGALGEGARGGWGTPEEQSMRRRVTEWL